MDTRGVSSVIRETNDVACRDGDCSSSETATVRTITLEVPDWPGHTAGQHVDVRLTAPDGYHAVRSYSIASAPNLSVLWEVFRPETNALLKSRTRAYLGNDFLFGIPIATVRGVQIDPATNGIQIGWRDPDYYFLDRIKVRCTVTATMGTQKSVVFSDEVVVEIPDDLDRTHNFVVWGPHQVFFASAGTNIESWTHNRTSKIDRTATGARCMMLRQRAEDTRRKRPKFRYFDTLPAEWNPLAEHRHFLCDYCFFGGPDKATPLPPEKWF